MKNEVISYKPLTSDNWEDFYNLFKKYHGVRGGCWCAYYICRPKDFTSTNGDGHLKVHKDIIDKEKTTGLILYVNNVPVGYCQVAKSDVLTKFNYSREYEKLSDDISKSTKWRQTCIFIDKGYRKRHLSSKLFDFAIEYISKNGGGWLEVFPFSYDGCNLDKFDFNGSVNFYLKRGFEKVTKLGKAELLMRKYIH